MRTNDTIEIELTLGKRLKAVELVKCTKRTKGIFETTHLTLQELNKLKKGTVEWKKRIHDITRIQCRLDGTR